MEFRSEFTTPRDKQRVADLHVCERLQALLFELENFRPEATEILKRDSEDPSRRILAGIYVNLQYEVAQWALAAK